MIFDHRAYQRALADQRAARDSGRFEQHIIPDCKSRKLMEQLLAGSLGPIGRLSEAVDLTLDQITRWIADPQNRQQINRLITLLDAQTQLLACQYRVLAISRLVQVISDAGNHETIRRACADLMKVRLIDPYREDKRPMDAAAVTYPLPSEDAVLAALEEMGRAGGVAGQGGGCAGDANFALDRGEAESNQITGAANNGEQTATRDSTPNHNGQRTPCMEAD